MKEYLPAAVIVLRRALSCSKWRHCRQSSTCDDSGDYLCCPDRGPRTDETEFKFGDIRDPDGYLIELLP